MARRRDPRGYRGLSWAAQLCLLASLVGCAADLGGGRERLEGDSGPGRDGGKTDDPTRRDAGPHHDGAAASSPIDDEDGGRADGGEEVSFNPPGREVCGNGMDDDDNGRIDEGCACTPGESRPCFPGLPELANVGACRPGTQLCDQNFEFPQWGDCTGAILPTREVIDNDIDDDCNGTVDDPTGVCVPSGDIEAAAACGNDKDDDCDTLRDCDDPSCVGAPGCPAACQAAELNCFGGVDDDCDGAVDCDDAECFDAPSCRPGPCPHGRTATYRVRNLGRSGGASSVMRGDGLATTPMTCESGHCEAGLVAVFNALGRKSCVPPPPPCDPGFSPSYVSTGVWRCDPPCDYIIHYGALFDGENVCAGPPDVSCPSGQVPTFDHRTEDWVCRATCSNTDYDRVYLDGALICIPC